MGDQGGGIRIRGGYVSRKVPVLLGTTGNVGGEMPVPLGGKRSVDRVFLVERGLGKKEKGVREKHFY